MAVRPAALASRDETPTVSRLQDGIAALSRSVRAAPGGWTMQRYRGIGFATAALAAGVLAASSIPAVAQSPAANPAADWASTISGPVVLSGWQSSPAEGNALTQALLSFQAKYPNIKVDYQPIGRRLPDRDGGEVRLRRRAGPVLCQRRLRPGVDRPGPAGAARRLRQRRPGSTPASSSRATPTCSSRAHAGTASPRTATPSGWPTTPTW